MDLPSAPPALLAALAAPRRQHPRGDRPGPTARRRPALSWSALPSTAWSPLRAPPRVLSRPRPAGPGHWYHGHHDGMWGWWWVAAPAGCSTPAGRRAASAPNPSIVSRPRRPAPTTGITATAPAPTTLRPELPGRLAPGPGPRRRASTPQRRLRAAGLALLRQRPGLLSLRAELPRRLEGRAASPPGQPDSPERGSRKDARKARLLSPSPCSPAAPACRSGRGWP